MSLFPIADSENFVVHYDPVVKQYRVIVFKDGHFLDEFWFDEYKEEDFSMQKALNNRPDFKLFKTSYNVNSKDYTFEQIKTGIDKFYKANGDVIKNEKEKYEEHCFEMLTNWNDT